MKKIVDLSLITLLWLDLNEILETACLHKKSSISSIFFRNNRTHSLVSYDTYSIAGLNRFENGGSYSATRVRFLEFDHNRIMSGAESAADHEGEGDEVVGRGQH